MAHEVPINLQPPNGPKQTKGRQHYPIRKLPNGAKPDFGHGNDRSEKHQQNGESKLKKAQGPSNGEKSNQGKKPDEEGKKSGKGKKENRKDAQNKQTANAAESSEAGAGKKSKNKKKGNTNAKTGEEGYAGSSFHSSPEALALPKPSFKTSPKSKLAQAPISEQAPPVTQSPSSIPPSRESPAQQNYSRPMPMAMPFVYQGMPPQGPPQYPVVAHPQAMPQGTGPNPGLYQPGFNYTVNPQGYINYHYPPGAVPPQHPLGMNAYGYPPNPQLQPPIMAPMANQAPSQAPPTHAEGRKITFNELMGSSK